MERPIRTIQKAVEEYFGITYGELVGEKRFRTLVRPRMLAMWLCRRLTDASLPEIGRAFHRDHTTVIHAIRRVDELKHSNAGLARAANELLAKLAAINLPERVQ